MILTFFVLTAFSLIGIQLYKGVLRGKCVYLGNNTLINITDFEYNQVINNNGNLNYRFLKH